MWTATAIFSINGKHPGDHKKIHDVVPSNELLTGSSLSLLIALNVYVVLFLLEWTGNTISQILVGLVV